MLTSDTCIYKEYDNVLFSPSNSGETCELNSFYASDKWNKINDFSITLLPNHLGKPLIGDWYLNLNRKNIDSDFEQPLFYLFGDPNNIEIYSEPEKNSFQNAVDNGYSTEPLSIEEIMLSCYQWGTVLGCQVQNNNSIDQLSKKQTYQFQSITDLMESDGEFYLTLVLFWKSSENTEFFPKWIIRDVKYLLDEGD